MKLLTYSKFIFLITLATVFSGCRTVFQDFTPAQIPANPSGIYTFSFVANLPESNRIAGSERAQIAINGEVFEMDKRDEGELVFSFDYQMPDGVTEARYYYIVSYQYNAIGGAKTATRYSTRESGQVYQARLINLYPIQLVNERGPVGSQVAVVGSGFTSQDVVIVGGQEALTQVHSANSLEFTVPSMPSGGPFPVAVRTGSGDLSAGFFRVDQSRIQLQPQALRLSSGETTFFILEIAGPAPRGGLRVNVQTDIPQSVIMREIIIPEGARSVNINVSGGQPDSGILLIEIPGYAPVEMPITVL